MIKNDANGTVYFTFEIFHEFPGFRHCFTSRIGGVSEGVYSSLNLGLNLGDKRESVLENFTRVCGAAGFAPESLVFSDQTHGVNVRRVFVHDAGKGFIRECDIRDADALITNDPRVALTAFFADCVPIFLYDPVKNVAGLAHAGWRGTLGMIGRHTLEAMAREFGSDPGDVLAGIGPSICGDCFEVGEDVEALFAEKFGITAGRRRVDLWDINKRILIESGVRANNVEIGGLCTMCRPDLFYSHRLTGRERGSMAGFVGVGGIQGR